VIEKYHTICVVNVKICMSYAQKEVVRGAYTCHTYETHIIYMTELCHTMSQICMSYAQQAAVRGAYICHIYETYITCMTELRHTMSQICNICTTRTACYGHAKGSSSWRKIELQCAHRHAWRHFQAASASGDLPASVCDTCEFICVS